MFEKECVANIYKMLVNVYEKDALDVSTIKRWVIRVNGNTREKGETELNDRPHSGRPAAALNENKAKQDYVLIAADGRIPIAKLLGRVQQFNITEFM